MISLPISVNSQNLWDEIHMIQTIPSCTCGASFAIHKFFEDQRLIQLLMGPDESYKIIRGQILMMKPLPSVLTAYSLIIQEERQRGINLSSNLSNDAIVMQSSSNSFRKLVTCNHCKKSGHTKAQCYRLNRFHSNFKFMKRKKDKTRYTVQNVASNDSPPIS